MVAEKLYFGVGLGGNLIIGYVFFKENTESSRYFGEKFNRYADRYIVGTGANGSGLVSNFDNVLIAGGRWGLFAFILIIGWLALNPDTRIFGISFLVFCLCWGVSSSYSSG